MSGRPRGANYRAAEDKALCEAWIEVSNDGGTGINQCGDEFYGRIKLVFDELVEERQIKVQDRAVTSLSSRSSTISASVSKFVDCHGRVTALDPSGRLLSDIEHQAVELYESTPGNGRFRFLQCWHVLKTSEKWGAWRAGIQDRQSSNKRARTLRSVEPEFDGATVRVEDQVQDDHARPLGQQKAKLDRANHALYARQVKATERMAKNAATRNQVAQEQVELNPFSLRPDDDDEHAKEYVALKRKIVLARLRKEAAALEGGLSGSLAGESSQGIDSGIAVDTTPSTSDAISTDSASIGATSASTASYTASLPNDAEILLTF